MPDPCGPLDAAVLIRSVAAGAYINSVAGATATMLLTVDSVLGQLNL